MFLDFVGESPGIPVDKPGIGWFDSWQYHTGWIVQGLNSKMKGSLGTPFFFDNEVRLVPAVVVLGPEVKTRRQKKLGSRSKNNISIPEGSHTDGGFDGSRKALGPVLFSASKQINIQ